MYVCVLIQGWTLDMIGASAFTWEIQHMLGHHPYTNLLDIDGEKRKAAERGHDQNESQSKADAGAQSESLDINEQESDPDVFSSFPFMRMHPSHPRRWFHKYQHLFAPLLFALMTLGKVFQQDWEMFRER